MALFYHRTTKQVSCNHCYTYFEAPDGPHEFIYNGQIFRSDWPDCPHCEQHPEPEEFIIKDQIPKPEPKLKDWGVF